MRLFAAPKDCHQLSAAGHTFDVDEKGQIDLTGTPQAVIDLLTTFCGVTPVQDDGPATDPVNDAPAAEPGATGDDQDGEGDAPEGEGAGADGEGAPPPAAAVDLDAPLQLQPGALRPGKKAKKA